MIAEIQKQLKKISIGGCDKRCTYYTICNKNYCFLFHVVHWLKDEHGLVNIEPKDILPQLIGDKANEVVFHGDYVAMHEKEYYMRVFFDGSVELSSLDESSKYKMHMHFPATTLDIIKEFQRTCATRWTAK